MHSKLLVRGGDHLRSRDQSGFAPQSKSVEALLLRSLLQLSSREADVNLADGEGGTALHHAAQNGRVAVVERLLRQPGVDAGKVKPGAGTPLHLATLGGKLLVVDLLLAKEEEEETAAAADAAGSLVSAVSKVLAGVPPPEAPRRDYGEQDQPREDSVLPQGGNSIGFLAPDFTRKIYPNLPRKCNCLLC